MKIFSVRFNQTGTTTLSICSRHWSFRHTSFGEAALSIRKKTDTKLPLALASRSQGLEDWPWASHYRDLDQALSYPRFILTRRCSPNIWFQSLCAYAARTVHCRFGALVYGYTIHHQYRDVHIRFCESHLKADRNYFCNRPHDLLKVCMEAGDEGRALADFRDTPLLDTLFPHA